MRYKKGDYYQREYDVYSGITEIREFLSLCGKVIYANNNVFILEADESSSFEIIGFHNLTLEECIEMYPGFDYKPNINPVYLHLIPLVQGSEDFIVDNFL